MSSIRRSESGPSLRGLETPEEAANEQQLHSPLPSGSSMASHAVFDSPDANKPRSNPLRRSLVLLLDRQRREQCEAVEESVQVDATNDAVLLPSDETLERGSSRRGPQLRLRPVASHDLDDYCNSCGGSTAPFRTPRQRRSSIPPRQDQSRPVPLPCRCHELLSPSSSFIPLSSTSRGEQLLLQLPDDPDESLQLWLDDDSNDGDGEHPEGQENGVFRRRVILQPKALQRSHSDPVYVSGAIHTSDSELPTPVQEPTSCEPALPGLLHVSSQSSATVSSPDDDAPDVADRVAPLPNLPFMTSSTRIPLLPTMATPETERPIKNIKLGPKNPTSGASSLTTPLQDGLAIPAAPYLEDSFQEEEEH